MHDKLGIGAVHRRLQMTCGHRVPTRDRPLDLFMPRAVVPAMEKRYQRSQGLCGLTDERNLDRILAADDPWFDIDLDGPSLSGRGIELGPGIVAAHHEQCVAMLHQIRTRGCAEMTHH